MPLRRTRQFLSDYTQGLTRDDLRRLFTRDAPEAYRFFARGIDEKELASMSRGKRILVRARVLFVAFTMKLSPVRRLLFGVAVLAELWGLLQSFRTIEIGHDVVIRGWGPGTFYLILGFALMNLLVLLEVADRLSLKNDLEIARQIQNEMLPAGVFRTFDIEAFGLTRPANTVGGDFFDLMQLDDGRVLVTLGDVSGKGSPAALLMALLLAIFRTLIGENLDEPTLAERLNHQLVRHTPASRFVTLCFAIYEPSTGLVRYVNAGHLPPLVRRRDGRVERLPGGGIALGMFEGSRYEAMTTRLEPGELLVMYSDGITEAENRNGQPFEDTGLEQVLRAAGNGSVERIARDTLRAVDAHAGDVRLYDDLTILVLKRVPSAAA